MTAVVIVTTESGSGWDFTATSGGYLIASGWVDASTEREARAAVAAMMYSLGHAVTD